MEAKSNPKTSLLKTIFKGLSEKDINSLYNLSEIKKLQENDILIKEGDLDKAIYIILNGEIKIFKKIQNQDKEIAMLKPGNWVGEIAFSRRTPRTATAIAYKPSCVMVLTESSINSLNDKTQLFIYKQMNELAANRVQDLLEKEKGLTNKNDQLKKYVFNVKVDKDTDYAKSEVITKIISKVPKLPVFSSTFAGKFLSEEISPLEIAKLIKVDPSLLATIMKAINSPYYGFNKKISDINHSIVLLGLNELHRLIISESMRNTMPNTNFFRQIHAHSVAISHISFTISLTTQIEKPAQMSTIGILHELGHIVISYLKKQNPKLAILIDSLDYTKMGSMLFSKWSLPDEIWKTVEMQSYPEFVPPTEIPPEFLNKVTILYFSHLCLMALKKEDISETGAIFLDEYKKILNWDNLSLIEIVKKHIMPTLKKEIKTLPSFFRKMVIEYLKNN